MPKKTFSEEERNQLKQAFALFDLDGNGFITNDELGTVLRKMGQEPSDEEVQQMNSWTMSELKWNEKSASFYIIMYFFTYNLKYESLPLGGSDLNFFI